MPPFMLLALLIANDLFDQRIGQLIEQRLTKLIARMEPGAHLIIAYAPSYLLYHGLLDSWYIGHRPSSGARYFLPGCQPKEKRS